MKLILQSQKTSYVVVVIVILKLSWQDPGPLGLQGTYKGFKPGPVGCQIWLELVNLTFFSAKTWKKSEEFLNQQRLNHIFIGAGLTGQYLAVNIFGGLMETQIYILDDQKWSLILYLKS